MNRHILGAAFALAALVAPFAAQAGTVIYTFDNPVTLSDTQAPGTWYTDRYPPNGFVGGVDLGGGRVVLQQSIAASDKASERPPAFSSAFYNTQGRKFDIPGTIKMSIELYVDASYASLSQRIAGFWGTGFDGGVVSAYPILEYTTDGVDRFRAYNVGTGDWVDYAQAITTDAWHTLEIELSGGLFKYSVDGDEFYSVGAEGSDEIGNVILQGHNTASEGSTYDIYWDNLTTVPEPATLLLLGFGVAGLGLARRRA